MLLYLLQTTFGKFGKRHDFKLCEYTIFELTEKLQLLSNHACSYYHAGRNCYPIVAHVLLIVAAVYNKIACLIERVSIGDTNRIC